MDNKEMNSGLACSIFRNINRSEFSDKEKEDAIEYVLQMPTTNGITKNEFKDALAWSMARQRDARWHRVIESDPSTYPAEEDHGKGGFVLLSFANTTVPVIGRCEGNPDDGFVFYDGDDDKPLSRYGLVVNGWMKLPESLTE